MGLRLGDGVLQAPGLAAFHGPWAEEEKWAGEAGVREELGLGARAWRGKERQKERLRMGGRLCQGPVQTGEQAPFVERGHCGKREPRLCESVKQNLASGAQGAEWAQESLGH